MYEEGSTTRAARGPFRLLVLGLALAFAGACEPMPERTATGSSGPGEQGASSAAHDPAAVDPAQWPEGRSPLQMDPAIERRVEELLAAMSLEEKVGQVIQADIASITPEEVRRYRLGSVLAGGNSAPDGRQYATAEAWLALADAFHAASMDTSGGHLAIPILFGIDAVHGHNNVIGGTVFPHNIGLGAARDPELVRRIAHVTAVELRATGADWTFAPTVAVPRDVRWGRTYEGYSEHPDIVASYAGVVVEGLQGRPGEAGFLDGERVLSSAKHFVGDGGTEEGRDQGDARISEAELRDIHAAGYPPAIAAGVQTVMASFSSWNGVKLHGHRGLLTDVLRGRMGFDGFVVGDWNGHGQVPGCGNEDCPAAFNAGIDMFMAPESWRGLYENTLRQVREGAISAERLDEAVGRILRVKLRMGLFEAEAPSRRPFGGRFELIGHPDHRALAREAVRRSLVLLKNQGGVLPLDPRGRILVAGDGADDIGKQSGGWTLTWQGTGTRAEDFPNGQSIWDGLREAVQAAGGQAELAVDGRYRARPDVAVVVFGEEPYAEFQGDIAHLAYKPDDDTDLALLRRLREDGIPVVAVFLSGRPLWTNREINASDAFVAAWLPGTEGGGVADVLLAGPDGSVVHDFVGKLSFSWPRTAVQVPLNVGAPDYDPLFPFGHGLSLADDGSLPLLPEVSGLDGTGGQQGVWLRRGEPGGGVDLLLEAKDRAPVRVTTVPAASADGALRVAAVDHLAQEDARRFVWRGPAAVALSSAAPVDIQRETNGDVLLVLSLRVEQAPAGDVRLGMRCGEGCDGTVDVAAALTEAAGHGGWERLGVPLKCLAAAGADMGRIDVPVFLQSDASLRVSLSRVALDTEYDRLLDCPLR